MVFKKKIKWFELAVLFGIPLVVLIVLLLKSPDSATLISLISLVASFLAEKYYVDKANILPNILIVGAVVLLQWNQAPQILQIYTVLGILIGCVALACHFAGQSLGKKARRFAYAFFSLKTVLPLYLTYLLVGLTTAFAIPVFAVLFIYSWCVAIYKLGHKNPVYVQENF